MGEPLNRTIMKKTLQLIIGLIFFSSVSAQSYTLNWASSFFPAWANGATTGNAINIGGSTINCSVSIVKSGGAYTNFGGPTTPTVGSSTVVAGSTNNMQVALDYSTASQYTDITFTFSTLVYNVNFNLADIDRLTNTSNSYYDRISITGMMGLTSVQPVIAKYDATTDPNFLNISGNVAQVNTTSGMAGNTASDATDQKGTIMVNFNGKSITSFTIRYDNVAGVAANPGIQFISVGNISFYKAMPLPVELTSFEGQYSNGKNILKWKSASESKMAYYSIERSENGRDFSQIGQASSLNSTSYVFNDKNLSNEIYYYRLKMVDIDGSFTYSKIISIRLNNSFEIKAFPSVFTSSLTVRTSSVKEEIIPLMLTDLSGKIVYRNTYKAKEGVNEFLIELPASLQRGQYFLVRADNNKSVGVIKQ